MDKLRIAYVSSLYPPQLVGGAEVIAAHLAEQMASDGHAVTVISTIGPSAARGRGASTELRNGVEVRRVFPWNLYWPHESRSRSLPQRLIWHALDSWNLDAGRKLGAILREFGPDVVHTHNVDGFSPIVWQVARRLGTAIVHTAHDYHLLCPRTTLLRSSGLICEQAPIPCRAYRRWHLSRTEPIDVFCAPTRFVMEMHRRSGVRAGGWQVVPNGIPLAPDMPLSDVSSESSGPLRLLYLGSLSSHKGVGTLLRAFASEPSGLDVRLDIAGRGPLEPQVREAAARDGRITFHGFVSGASKDDLLGSCEALVLPSEWHENAPIAVIEAYAHGLAVLASAIGGLPEMVVDGRTGLLFPAGDSRALRDAIRKLAEDRGLLGRLRRQALEASADYDRTTMARKYSSVYTDLVCRRNRPRGTA